MGINNHIELVRRLCSNRTGATARGQKLWGFSRHLGSVLSTAPKQPSNNFSQLRWVEGASLRKRSGNCQ